MKLRHIRRRDVRALLTGLHERGWRVVVTTGADRKTRRVIGPTKGYSANTVRLVRATLSAVLARALDDELIDVNPCLGLGRRGQSAGPRRPGRGHPELVARERRFVERAKKAGLEHLVKFSAIGAHPAASFTFGRQHGAAERLIIDSGLPFTFIQPNFFMQNLLWSVEPIRTVSNMNALQQRSPRPWPSSP